MKHDYPNDIEELKKLLAAKEQELHSKDQEIKGLRDTILLLRRKKFAPSSEASNQLNLFNEVEDIIEADTEEEVEVSAHTKRKRGKRAPLPENLPRIDEIIDLPEAEKAGLECIGEEVSEELVIEPAKVFVKRIIRKKYAAKGSGVKLPALPEKLLPKTMASSSLLAYIMALSICNSLNLPSVPGRFQSKTR